MATKRILDVAIASTTLAVLSPVLGVLTAFIRWKHGRPVLFRQERTGHLGRPFTILKLRTMTHAVDDEGELLPDNQRITRLGRFLRRTSLDELPQLVNVIRGDMSLVGPRPLLPRYDPWYSETERRRFLVRPGITGLTQVAGKQLSGWDESLACDVQYVDEWSLGLDLRILGRTVRAVITREVGVASSAQGSYLDQCRQAQLASTEPPADGS